MKRLILMLTLLIPTWYSLGQYWTHVGPKSSNRQDVDVNGVLKENLFETGQINIIEVDPNNSEHMFCGGKFAGLWRSISGGNNWEYIPTSNVLGVNGISQIKFYSNSEIIIPSHHVPSYPKKAYSTGIAKYNFVNSTWVVLGDIPIMEEYLIYDIAVVEHNNTKLVFVATSKGLYRTNDLGANWVQLITNSVQSIVFSSSSANIGFKGFAVGNDAVGNVELFNSTSPLGSWSFVVNPPMFSGSKNTESLVVFGKTVSAQDYELFVLSDLEGSLKLNRVSFYNGAWSMTGTGGGPIKHGGRSALCYDSINDCVWYGGVFLHLTYNTSAFNITYSGVKHEYKSTNGNIHSDIHDIDIYTDENAVSHIIIAHDGGVVRDELPMLSVAENPSETLYFNTLNNQLNACIVNGFSGAADNPNFYSIGAFDITNQDFYDADEERNVYTEVCWENDGSLIDRFNSNRIIFDLSSYNGLYRVAEVDEMGSFTFYGSTTPHANSSSVGQKYYLANETDPFSADLTQELSGSNRPTPQGFSRRIFNQDPFRPNRIFMVKHSAGLFQYDFANRVFFRKVNLSHVSSIESEWSVNWRDWKGISFSPQDRNSVYLLLKGDPSSHQSIKNPLILKYVGNNFDTCFEFNLPHTDSDGNPQWSLISESLFNNFQSVTGCNLSPVEKAHIEVRDIETSPWNKDRIYVTISSPACNKLKVVRCENGVWSDYSVGIPEEEIPNALVMDYASNDCLYLSTDQGVYYRCKDMSSWATYSGNVPKMRKEQLEINYIENTLRAGTFGLGIWKTDLVCPTITTLDLNFFHTSKFYEAQSIVSSGKFIFDGEQPLAMRAVSSITLNPGFSLSAGQQDYNYMLAYIHGCNSPGTSSGFRNSIIEGGEEFSEGINKVDLEDTEVKLFTLFPNPTTGDITITFDNPIRGLLVIIFDSFGRKVKELQYSQELTSLRENLNLPKGVYFVSLKFENEVRSEKLVIN